MALDEVNERSTSTVTASFTDEDGDAVVPTAGTYRIDDVGSGTVILDETDLPDLASSVDLEITEDENRILTESNPYELRRITVEYDYGDDKHGSEQYDYRVKNLSGVTTPESPA